MKRHIGKQSRERLALAAPEIIIVSTYAFAIPTGKYDWTVFETLRTMERQEHYFATGVSKTLDSWHLPQADGLAYAIDLVPIVDGRISWDDKKDKARNQRIKDAFKNIADNMYTAMARTGIDLDWGFEMWGWDMPHWQTKKRPTKA